MNTTIMDTIVKSLEEQQGLKILNQKGYVYTFPVTASLPAGTSGALSSITLQLDSVFAWEETVYFLTEDAETDGTFQSVLLYPEITAQLTNTSSGELMFNRPTPLSSIAGDARRPMINTVPRLIMPKATLQLELSNYSATHDYTNIFVSLIGRKLMLG